MTNKHNILIVCDDKNTVDYLSFLVFKYTDSTVEVIKGIEEVKIKAIKELDLLIIALPQQNGLQDFFSEQGKLKSPILFVADDNHIHLANDYIPYHPLCSKISYNLSELIIKSAILRMLKMGERKRERNLEKAEASAYMELPISLFIKDQKLQYDLYLKMKESKYIKVYRKNDELVKADFEKYQTRNITSVFLKEEDYLKASVEFSNKITKTLKTKKLRVATYTKFAAFNFDKVNTIINSLGLREEVLILTNEALEVTEHLLKSNKKLHDLLKMTLNGEGYLSEHSLFMTFITTSIARYMGWASVTTSQKLLTACFFHDIALSDDTLAKLDRLDNETEALFTSKEIKLIQNHPQKSVEILSKFEGLPLDVDKIILQHHEKHDGSGFPRGLSEKTLFNLSIVFIVAEEFTNKVFESGIESFEVERILNEMSSKYTKGNFSLATEALKVAMGFSCPKIVRKAA